MFAALSSATWEGGLYDDLISLHLDPAEEEGRAGAMVPYDNSTFSACRSGAGDGVYGVFAGRDDGDTIVAVATVFANGYDANVERTPESYAASTKSPESSPVVRDATGLRARATMTSATRVICDEPNTAHVIGVSADGEHFGYPVHVSGDGQRDGHVHHDRGDTPTSFRAGGVAFAPNGDLVYSEIAESRTEQLHVGAEVFGPFDDLFPFETSPEDKRFHIARSGGKDSIVGDGVTRAPHDKIADAPGALAVDGRLAYAALDGDTTRVYFGDREVGVHRGLHVTLLCVSRDGEHVAVCAGGRRERRRLLGGAQRSASWLSPKIGIFAASGFPRRASCIGASSRSWSLGGDAFRRLRPTPWSSTPKATSSP